jgi:hypothetical protein
MRRLLRWNAVLALALAGLVFPGLVRADLNLTDEQDAYNAALAIDPTLDPPPADGSPFAVGGFQGIGAIGNNNIAFSAHFDPNGNAIGYVSVTVTSDGIQAPVQVRGDVTCLSVSGSNAALGYVITDTAANDPLPPGFQAVLTVHDGNASDGTGDLYAFANGAPANTCPDWVGIASNPITNGNINVHD